MAVYTNAMGGGGLDTDELTATAGDVIKGKTAGVKGSDEPVEGALELTGDADETHVLAGKGFYTTNPKVKQMGTMPRQFRGQQATSCVIWEGNLYYRFPYGYYGPDFSETESEIRAPQDAVAYAAGLTADKLWPGQSVLGVVSNRPSMDGGTYTPSASQQIIGCAGNAMNGNIVIAGDGNLVAANIRKGVSIFGVAGTYEGFVKNVFPKIYSYGINHDGYSIGSAFIKDGYYSVGDTQCTIETVKKYDCDRANGVLVSCHKNQDTYGTVEPYVYDEIYNGWVPIKYQQIESTSPQPHYFSFNFKSGMMRLRFVFQRVNITEIALY